MGLKARQICTTAALAAVVSFWWTPVFAEVCDKIYPEWDGQKFSVLNEVAAFLTNWVGLAALFCLVTGSAVLRLRALLWVGSLLGGLLLLVATTSWGDAAHQVWQSAINEGCAHPQFELIQLLSALVLTATGVFLGLRRRKRAQAIRATRA
ncbi:hypothetical protein [Ensifer adhaerens]|uniref:hypothetical protein n=1 Tax=Ensifer adhaerens TaxID=106592 RepID=UPI001C4E23EF|nr:hypothetical protein [Ensifer adhaerens]MBW0366295.1 hypothetical protein [Ensifer adhaerens]UCM19818.1 hypothetical protein LDL63_18725 [Ensifer adhaerens]